MAGGSGLEGFERARSYPLFDALFNRRTRRVSRGLSYPPGALSLETKREPLPLSQLEEAMLIVSTGVSGFVLPDHSSRSEKGEPIPGTVLLRASGLTAASPDNAHATHWFFWNDRGTYLVKHPSEPPAAPNPAELSAAELIARVEGLKVELSDQRLTFPHRFPAELHRNRFASNVPGSTIFVPVQDLTEQYINGLLLVFSQGDGDRPVFRDDFNFWRVAGLGKWVRSGFLNREVPVPLSAYGKSVTEAEAVLLTQNLALAAEAMGLGGWLHFAPHPIVLLGGTALGKGLGFRFVEPHLRDDAVGRLTRPVKRLRRKLLPFPAGLPNPVGLDGHIEAFCPPYYKDMDAAVDAVLAKKFSRDGLYQDERYFSPIFKREALRHFLDDAAPYPDEAIECTRAVCNYIYETYGRFPAHATAMHAPAAWFQVHHIDTEFYDAFYTGAYSAEAAEHERLWHGA